jgi:D-alanine-D-alanine ligase-like ATP-grasp enzyme
LFDPIRHPRLLRLRVLWDRIQRKLAHQPPGREEADRQLSAFYERVWREAAAEIGASVLDLGSNVLEIRRGERWTRVWHHYTGIDTLAAHHIVRTKGVMHRLLAAHDLPSPRHLEFSPADMQPAACFLESTSRPCVVKPACGTGGGLGVVTGIRTRWQLARAAWAAAVSGDHPLIEEQVEGENYRLLYLDGELLDVVKREPPAVRADGVATVQQLVERLNRERLAGQGALAHGQLTLDLDVQATLQRQGLSLRSVPPAGTRIQLKTAINENSAHENVSAPDELCADILRETAQAVQLSGLRLAGVDIICADPRRSLRASGGVILEVNSPPGFFWHYHKRAGSFPIALYILRALFGLTAAPNPTRNGSFIPVTV